MHRNTTGSQANTTTISLKKVHEMTLLIKGEMGFVTHKAVSIRLNVDSKELTDFLRKYNLTVEKLQSQDKMSIIEYWIRKDKIKPELATSRYEQEEEFVYYSYVTQKAEISQLHPFYNTSGKTLSRPIVSVQNTFLPPTNNNNASSPYLPKQNKLFTMPTPQSVSTANSALTLPEIHAIIKQSCDILEASEILQRKYPSGNFDSFKSALIFFDTTYEELKKLSAIELKINFKTLSEIHQIILKNTASTAAAELGMNKDQFIAYLNKINSVFQSLSNKHPIISYTMLKELNTDNASYFFDALYKIKIKRIFDKAAVLSSAKKTEFIDLTLDEKRPKGSEFYRPDTSSEEAIETQITTNQTLVKLTLTDINKAILMASDLNDAALNHLHMLPAYLEIILRYYKTSFEKMKKSNLWNDDYTKNVFDIVSKLNSEEFQSHKSQIKDIIDAIKLHGRFTTTAFASFVILVNRNQQLYSELLQVPFEEEEFFKMQKEFMLTLAKINPAYAASLNNELEKLDAQYAQEPVLLDSADMNKNKRVRQTPKSPDFNSSEAIREVIQSTPPSPHLSSVTFTPNEQSIFGNPFTFFEDPNTVPTPSIFSDESLTAPSELTITDEEIEKMLAYTDFSISYKNN